MNTTPGQSEAQPIIRTADALYRQTRQVAAAFRALPEFGATLADIPQCCVLEREPLDIPRTAREKRLAAAWDSLGSVRIPAAETLEALLTVLIETVFEDAERPLGPLPFTDAAAPQVRPTAAHPRAYQGTKYKPPRDRAPQAVDPRPYLRDRVAVSELLSRLAPFRDAAVSTLSRQGYETPGAASQASDPYAAWNHDCLQGILTPGLDPVFRTVLLPALRGRPWSDVERLQTLFFRLRLKDRADLTANIAALVEEAGDVSHAIGWCDFLTALPESDQSGFAGLLLKTCACTFDPGSLPPGFTDIVRELAAGIDSAYRVYCLLDTLAMGRDCRYLLSGFRLNDRIYHDDERRVEADSSTACSFPDNTAQEILAHITVDNASERWRVFHLWKACSRLSGLGEFLASYDWTRWPPSVTCELLELFDEPTQEEDDDGRTHKWRLVRAHAEGIESSLEATPPEYRWKFCNSLRKFISCTNAGEMTERSLPDACAFLARLCRPPFHRHRNTAFVWADFLAYFSPEQIGALLETPDSSFVQMEKACRNRNNATHVGLGTWALGKEAPALMFAGWLHAPSALFRTAKTLGCLSREEGLRFVRDFMRLPMMLVDPGLLDDGDTYTFMREFCPAAIPKPLRAHYEGVALLNSPRLAHYHLEMRRLWVRARLERLEEAVIERLVRSFDLEEIDADMRHALQIQQGTKENRKALRKLLAAHWAGREDYVLAHPLTQAWLKKHPKFDLDLWTTGIAVTGETASHGMVTITLERAPLEALKLGTYVGSCLGLGGILEFSAAATVLDINKQVLYARDSSGAVVGRQVVAYSEAGEMVCFSVYPYRDDNPLHPLFEEYDRRLAAALGVPLFIPNEDIQDDDYVISGILSHGWYDDGVWDRLAESLMEPCSRSEDEKSAV